MLGSPSLGKDDPASQAARRSVGRFRGRCRSAACDNPVGITQNLLCDEPESEMGPGWMSTSYRSGTGAARRHHGGESFSSQRLGSQATGRPQRPSGACVSFGNAIEFHCRPATENPATGAFSRAGFDAECRFTADRPAAAAGLLPRTGRRGPRARGPTPSAPSVRHQRPS